MATARDLLTTRVPRIRGLDGSVAEALETMRHDRPDTVETVYLVDPGGGLLGVVACTRLLAADPETVVATLAESPPQSVTLDTDQEDVATVAHRHDLAEVPVVDGSGILVGAVPARVLVDVLRREHIEDLHRLSGAASDAQQGREALYERPMRRLAHRLPWLLVGLAGSMLATAIVASFERSLEETVAIAFFVPGIVYLADAIGTQTEAVAVRGLSFGPVAVGRLFAVEIGAGVLIGAALGAVALAGVGLWFSDFRLAVVVGISLLIAGTLATTIGLVFPLLLHRFGVDPAYGSGPVATIIQDVLSLLAYFTCAQLLL